MMESIPPACSQRRRILVVDDEPNIRSSLVRALALSGYETHAADSGASALELLAHQSFDVMILDLQMPGIDGMTTMQRARAIHSDLAILILTGHATLESAIAAVKADAADYLLKPSSVKDIVAAVEHTLRRRTTDLNRQQLLRTAIEALQQAETLDVATPTETLDARKISEPERFLTLGRLTLDRAKLVAVIAGEPVRTIALTQGELVILDILATDPDQPYSCQELARQAWNYDLDELNAESLVRPYISRLRHKLEDDAKEPTLIRTVRGRGYVLTP